MSSRRNSNSGTGGNGGSRGLTDEDLARALQRQYEREFQASQQQLLQQLSQPPTPLTAVVPTSERSSAPRRSSSLGGGGGGVTVAEQRSRASSRSRQTPAQPQQQPPQLRSPPPPPSPPRDLTTLSSDEEFARSLMLLEEERARAAAQRALSRRQQSRDERRSSVGGTIVAIPSSAPIETNSMRGGMVVVAEQAKQQPRKSSMNNSNNNSFGSDHNHNGGFGTPLTSRESSLVSQEIDDEELAMRLQQEMRDEEIARQIQTTETDRITAQNAQRMAEIQQAQQLQQQQQPKRGCTPRRICSCVTSLIVLGAAAAALLYYFLVLGNGLPNWIPSPEDFVAEDPFKAKKPSEANKWENDGRGITLEVLNALDDYWYPYFNQAVSDWDNGYPDSLTLVTSIREPERDCTTVNGKVKVCNGNYGNTHWKGINEVLIDRMGNIFASSARMNEYYLGAPGDPDQMQYTMCHEIGHAWGLPHTDELFGNKDLGNCMDYSNNPAFNKQPDITNYQFLYELYGLVPGAAPYTPPTQAPSQASSATTANIAVAQEEDAGQGKEEEKGAKNRDEKDRVGRHRQKARRRLAHDEDEPLEDWLQAAVNAAKASLLEEEMHPSKNQEDAATASASTTSNRKWRLLRQAPHGESHEIDLDHGYRFQIHKLYA